jgi:hypothetical protein
MADNAAPAESRRREEAPERQAPRTSPAAAAAPAQETLEHSRVQAAASADGAQSGAAGPAAGRPLADGALGAIRQGRSVVPPAAPRPFPGADADTAAVPLARAWLDATAAAGWRWRNLAGVESALPAGWLNEFARATRSAWSDLDAAAAAPTGETWELFQQGRLRARLIWTAESVVLCETGRACQTARLDASMRALRDALPR